MNRKSYAALALAGALATGGGTVHAQDQPVDGLSLAKAQNCMSCHSVTRPFMGPAFHDIAQRYASLSDARTYLARKIVEGSTGVWGPVPMPANTQLSPDQAVTLANWILTLK